MTRTLTQRGEITRVYGCRIVTCDPARPDILNGELEFERETGRFTYVGPLRDAGRGDGIDATGQVAMPGLVNAHTHTPMVLMRGYSDAYPLQRWLQAVWKIEEQLTVDDMYWATQLALAEMLRSGTTAFNDMYFYDDLLVEGVVDSGLRATLSLGLLASVDLFRSAVPAGAPVELERATSLMRRWHGAANGRMRMMLAPHAPYTCPPDYLMEIVERAHELGAGIHIHLSETRREVRESLEQHGMTPIALAERSGIFSAHTVAAHCVHATKDDIDILAERGTTWVAHNPGSNLKLGSGIAPVAKMLAAGVQLALGTDGAASNNNLDMFEEVYLAATLHKGVDENAELVAPATALEMGSVCGARALGHEGVGPLMKGNAADFILLSLDAPHLVPVNSITSQLVYAARGADVLSLFVDGVCLMRDRVLMTIDEERAKREVRRRAQRLVQG